jgi:hypothetical protein
MAEAPRLLRDKIGEALTALQRNFGKVAEDSEEAESLEAPERMLSLLSPGPFASYEDDALERAEGEFEAGGEASIAAKPW